MGDFRSANAVNQNFSRRDAEAQREEYLCVSASLRESHFMPTGEY